MRRRSRRWSRIKRRLKAYMNIRNPPIEIRIYALGVYQGNSVKSCRQYACPQRRLNISLTSRGNPPQILTVAATEAGLFVSQAWVEFYWRGNEIKRDQLISSAIIQIFNCMSEPNKVSLEQLSRFINSKQELYDSTMRNGFFLPKIKSSIVTQEYLLLVISGEVWCPQFKEIKLLPCVRPPPKQVLLEKVTDIAEKMKKPTGISEGGQPDKAWLVSVLSTFSPRDEIFDKGYLPPPKPNAIKNLRLIELPIGFLKNLPHSKNSQRRNSLALVREGKLAAKKQKLSIQRERLESRLAALDQSEKLSSKSPHRKYHH